MGGERNLAGKLSAPLIAAGASLATRYAVKKGPELVEHTVLPWLRETTQGAGGVVEKLPEKTRSTIGGGDLAEQLTDRAHQATGRGGGDNDGPSGEQLSQDVLSRRTDERAKRRAQRRKATKKKK